MQNFKSFIFLVLILTMISCGKDSPEEPEIDEAYFAGGETTTFEPTVFAYSTPAPNLNADNLFHHLEGDAQFEVSFVTSPAETAQGLGSVFNNKSCISCHPADGRAPRPDNLNTFSGFFLRCSVPGMGAHGGPSPMPGYGTQVQNQAVYGVEPEAEYEVVYIETDVTYPDGSKATLRKPTYSLKNNYLPIPPNALLSPRVGMPVFGLGLLEAISEEDILANQDIQDRNNDGISGKANYVWDEQFQETRIGRFGWKANTPSVMIQSAGAYNGDMGVTSPLFPKQTCEEQSNCNDEDNKPEIDQQTLDDVVLYLSTLAVPAPRDLESVKIGRNLFEEIGCVSCHIPKMKTSFYVGIPAISHQTIYPYTDMLLHDMGFGLADNRPDFLADGQEWKTRPLWGIGLTELVNGHTNFLHDGRARNFEEAILWHGGEAANSMENFKRLEKRARDELIAFLQAL